MEGSTAIGAFLVATGMMILVPVLLQVRDGRYQWREIRGMLLLSAGFVVVGVGYAFYTGAVLQRLALLGLGGVLLGLFVQHRRRDGIS